MVLCASGRPGHNIICQEKTYNLNGGSMADAADIDRRDFDAVGLRQFLNFLLVAPSPYRCLHSNDESKYFACGKGS